jgi:hypothetical protein
MVCRRLPFVPYAGRLNLVIAVILYPGVSGNITIYGEYFSARIISVQPSTKISFSLQA